MLSAGHAREVQDDVMYLKALLVAALLTIPTPAAQPAPPQTQPAGATAGVPTMADAQARMVASDFAGAAKVLEAITSHAPGNQRAWQMLGTAYLRSKDADRAIVAFQKVLALQPQSWQAVYNIGAAHALKNDVTQAFEWLAKARASHQIDMSQIDLDANLVALRADPRFARLRPTDADFAHAFVEPVTIIREWRGESANDQFGWIARNLGDVDGDRLGDVVTSAPTKAIGGAGAGRIYVYSSGTSSLLWTADGQPGDQLGLGVESAGDTNHDGTPDVIASAPGGGYAKVYSGPDGRVLLTLRGEDRADAFGRHVAGIGDVDRDGYEDVIVGAPGNDAGGDGAGRAYVYSGKDGHALLTLTGERAQDGFGSAVAGYAKGTSMLLLVGAPGAGESRTGTHVCVRLAVVEAEIHHRGRRDGRRARRDVPVRARRRRRRRRGGRLRVRLREQREGTVHGAHRGPLRKGRASSSDAHGRNGWRRVRHEPVGGRRRRW